VIEGDRWEHGSEFHWPLPSSGDTGVPCPWSEDPSFLGSGRDAFRFLIAHGIQAHAWRRLWVPSYMCQHVVETLTNTGIKCMLYEDAPDQAAPKAQTLSLESGDALLAVNYFGLRDASALDAIDMKGASLIVDHTHDLLSSWAFDSKADYAIASLRKTLPTPDGGVLWSPKAHALPSPPALTQERAMAARAKWKAMRLKAHYLAGELVSKSDFRALASEGESQMAAGEISGIYPETEARLGRFPQHAWRDQRAANHQAACERLDEVEGLRVLTGVDSSCPFSLFVVFESSQKRDHTRQQLIDNMVYPALLWPLEACVLEGTPERHRGLAHRSLSIHCDMRYSREDMQRVADIIVEAMRE